MFIRRMSNDDKPSDFRELIRALRPGEHEHVILAFCPVFDKDAADVLQDLHKHYDISAFVLKHSFDRRDQISEKEIASLRDFGDIEVFDQHAGPTERAAALRAFIERHFH
ncbi:MAG: hypothetical protein IPK83_24520 [Planctomycetes bacterium]|nr:hypothetical protein [Planctomycetota bacterium]